MKKPLIVLLVAFFGILFWESAALHVSNASEDDQELKTGEDVYTKQCLPCHSPGGNSPLPDMNLADDKWKHGNSLEDILKVITDGVQGTAMQSFKDRLNEAEILAVAKYVRTFQKKKSESSE